MLSIIFTVRNNTRHCETLNTLFLTEGIVSIFDCLGRVSEELGHFSQLFKILCYRRTKNIKNCTPSPAISVITLSSSDEENEQNSFGFVVLMNLVISVESRLGLLFSH